MIIPVPNEMPISIKGKGMPIKIGEDFWRWQTMNPNGYKGGSTEDSNGTASNLNGKHSANNGNGIAQEASNGR